MIDNYLLHCHYSGAVRNSTLISFIQLYKLNIIIKQKKVYLTNNQLSFDGQNLLPKIKQIQEILNKTKDPFNDIGQLWFHLIKHYKFIYHYDRLLILDMIESNIKHIELRLTLGSHFYKPQNFIPIEQEIRILYGLKSLYQRNQKSMVIICQYSKCKKNISKYFIDIINILVKYPHFLEIIKAFDLVGYEDLCYSLDYFKNQIIEIKQKLESHHLNIPFVFHAGEIENPIQKSLNNILFALKYGSNRIAHGIQILYSPNILKEIKKKKILLEVCPISNLKLRHIKDPTIYYKLYQQGIRLSINTDDPNKLVDCTIEDNYNLLLNNGFQKKDLRKIIKWSKDYSL